MSPGRADAAVRPAGPVRWLTAVLLTPEETAAAAERFWAAVTATVTRTPSARGTTLVPATGDPWLRLERTGGAVAAVRLDLHVDDPDATADDAIGRGAEPVADPGGGRVLRSPGGFAFRLVEWGGTGHSGTGHSGTGHSGIGSSHSGIGSSGEVERPAAGPGGRPTTADQICLDLLPDTADAEIAFWVGLTGWAPRGIDRPEFTFLERPSGLPLRILLQRLDGATAATAAGAHLDVGCNDPEATLARHVDLGALVVARHPWWTVLRDPAGRPYCLVRRGI
ncbi:MAG: VOC family protein [Pseudonocardia sp.]